MIGVMIEILVIDLDDNRLDSICDGFASVDPILDDLCDWSIGADLSKKHIEIDMTLTSNSPDIAMARSQEILDLVMEMSGFARLVIADASKVTAEVIPA